MIKTTIKVCFCFLDRAVWFVDNSRLLPYWVLNSKLKNKDDTPNDDEHFILERQTTNDNFIFKQTIVCSCMDCFRFQVSISSEGNFSCLSNVNCQFVKKDLNVFDNTFNDDIFVGDHQFVVSRYFQPREQLLAMTEREKIVFLKRPLHKSCFTSLRKKRYKHFCTSCKKIYNDFFEKKFHVFSRID